MESEIRELRRNGKKTGNYSIKYPEMHFYRAGRSSNTVDFMQRILSRRARVAVLAAAIIVVSLASVSWYVLAPPPPSTNAPMPLSQYGVVRLYASVQFTGTAKITINNQGFTPFFVSRLTLFLSSPADFDVLLDTINIDGTGPIQVSSFLPSSKVVVVASGLQVGDIVSSIPSYLSVFIVKDPMGNDALIANGGSGVVIGIRFASGGIALGTTISAIATIVAPTNSTVTMSMG